MAKKPTLSDVSIGYLSSTQLNANNTEIEDAFDNTLSRDGSSPNTMNADLDLNSNDILNAGAVAATSLSIAGVNTVSTSAVPDWEGPWVTATGYVLNDMVSNSGNSYICIVAHTSGTFATDLGTNYWEIMAAKGAAGAGTGDLLAANDLSDVDSVSTALVNLGLVINTDIQKKELWPLTVTAGSSTVYTLAPANPPTAYASGQLFPIRFHTATGVSATLNVNSLGPKNLIIYDTGGNLDGTVGGLVQQNQVSFVQYDGTQFILMTNTTYGNAAMPGVVKVLDDDALASDSSAWPSSTQSVKAYSDARLGAPSWVIEDQKTSGTEGGAATSGSWETRDLNTEVRDVDGTVSITTNQFTPTTAGWVEWSAPAHKTDLHQTRLYNVTDSTVDGTGTSVRSGTGVNISTSSEGGGPVIAAKAYRIEHRVETTRATNGHGTASSFGTEVYARIKFWRT